jgi:transposase
MAPPFDRVDDRRVISGIIHVLKNGCRWRIARLNMVLRQRSTIALWLGAAGHLGKSVSGAGRERTIYGHADDRLDACQSAPLGRAERGEQKQGVGHSLAAVKGRLIAILLTGGEVHDCPVAERLIRRVKSSKCMLGDTDSASLREELGDYGTKP